MYEPDPVMQKDLELLGAVRESFKRGVTRDFSWRRSQLLALETFLVECEEEIAGALHADFRKSGPESFLTETGYLRSEIRFALNHLKAWMKPSHVSIPLIYQPAKAFYRPEPYGVVLIIGAWNYPLNLALAPLIGAVAAGNCVVLKPSEHAPHTSSLLAEKLPCYLDRSAIGVIEGDGEKSRELLLERFDYIFYTGSRMTGREVMHAAARHLTPLTLELGGKSPCIVDEKSDVRVAARRIVWAKFLNAGQTCISPDYVLVHHCREMELLREMQQALREFYGADPKQSPDYPRIVNDYHFQRLEKLLEASSVWSGGESDPAERYLAPTILRGVSADSLIMQSEIFGPLLPVIGYQDLAEAVALVQSEPEPLALYIFSSDPDVQELLMRQLRSGGVCINDLLFHAATPSLPFGGLGSSGFGAYHGRAGFETFSFQRSVLRRSLWPDPGLRYPPYGPVKFALLKRLVTFFH